MAKHSDHCDLLERDDCLLLIGSTTHWSMVLIAELCWILYIFSVSSGALIPDIMHDVLEGALPLEVKLMLKVILFVYL